MEKLQRLQQGQFGPTSDHGNVGKELKHQFGDERVISKLAMTWGKGGGGRGQN